MPIFSNESSQLFFIHIPKCGGTSIEKYLQKKTGNIAFFDPDPSCFLCTPQHFDRSIISSLFPKNYNLKYFTIVRHPVTRLISEYFHVKKRKKNIIVDFNIWVENIFNSYISDSYVNDNHIKPQSLFIMPNTSVFKFEDGLEAPLQFATLNLNLEYTDLAEHEKNWKKDNIKVKKRTIELIESFYQSDMKTFNYESLLPKTDDILFNAIKIKLKEQINIKNNAPILINDVTYMATNTTLKKQKLPLRENALISLIRDIAINNEVENKEISRDLFTIALKYRPDGKTILEKLLKLK